jgi:hypothetical protein
LRSNHADEVNRCISRCTEKKTRYFPFFEEPAFFATSDRFFPITCLRVMPFVGA